jgi:hypothetical protein
MFLTILGYFLTELDHEDLIALGSMTLHVAQNDIE